MQTCVIVDGFGPCGSGWDDMIKARDRLLLSGMNVVHIDGGKGGPNRSLQVASLLESEKKPNAIIFFGFGSGGDGSDGYFYSPHMGRYFRKALKSWCAAGGRFIVQGERIAYTGRWPSWFGKSWIDGDYFRTDHKCFAVGSDATNWCEWYKNSQGAMLSTYNVKACMLKNVDPTEVLFGSVENARSYSLVEGFGGQEIGEGSTAVAFAQFESGTVSFFGDVNHEDKTIQIMAVIACGQQKCR
eukprot:CAMPEP_0195293046 /NCGR_PEP_ID=MMETSP0707-20130614/11538_1 /TAXON_ID=33640 /ORGANISM="Asterionellopsis glacialis, Strain CCMP134" /LENGTH=241 /DNA_ID=CAMNT_0040353671 /DNA_START=193 /DNA_END=918 /DNA_ORIENTATION=+